MTTGAASPGSSPLDNPATLRQCNAMAPRPMEVTIGRGLTLYVQELACIGCAHEAQAWCSCHPDWQVRVVVSDHLAAACEGPEQPDPRICVHDPEPAALTLLRGEAYEAHKAAR